MVSAAKLRGKVAILDAGSQYGKLIDRRVREARVESDMLPFSTPASVLAAYGAVIVSGGPKSVAEPSAPEFDAGVFGLGVPVLGVCYGMQMAAHALEGGGVEKLKRREDGQHSLVLTAEGVESELFADVPQGTTVLLTHGDSVVTVPGGFVATSHSEAGIISSMEDTKRGIYGVQFHPEVDLCTDGTRIISNFLFRIAKLAPAFTMSSRLDKAVASSRAAAGDDKTVLVLVSGGVDSTVCAALLHRALPAERIRALHVDNGFMRLGESRRVEAALNAIGLDVEVVDAGDAFLSAKEDGESLRDTVNPERKRRIIGNTFMDVTDRAVSRWNLDPERVLLAQGTLRPDLIESASTTVSGAADVIKTHHNDTALVRVLRDAGRIVEPLSDYHKDEVRRLGTELGLPEELVWRQPFPGPGLAIRLLCAREPYATDADSQTVVSLSGIVPPSVTATLLPVRTVGVQGDARSYSSLVAISCGTERVASVDWPLMMRLSKEIPCQIPSVNRVIYVIGSRLSAGRYTRITETTLTPDAVQQLRLADDVVSRVLTAHKLVRVLSQVPVVLFPVPFGVDGGRSICVRAFVTNDFMTGSPAMPGSDALPIAALEEMVAGILGEVPGIARVCVDLTSKPPATTEWE